MPLNSTRYRAWKKKKQARLVKKVESYYIKFESWQNPFEQDSTSFIDPRLPFTEANMAKQHKTTSLMMHTEKWQT